LHFLQIPFFIKRGTFGSAGLQYNPPTRLIHPVGRLDETVHSLFPKNPVCRIFYPIQEMPLAVIYAVSYKDGQFLSANIKFDLGP
jgi:hypothetical protein